MLFKEENVSFASTPLLLCLISFFFLFHISWFAVIPCFEASYYQATSLCILQWDFYAILNSVIFKMTDLAQAVTLHTSPLPLNKNPTSVLKQEALTE